MHQQLGRRMIELVRGDGFQKTHLIHDAGKMGKMFTHPGPALSVLRKLCLGAKHLGHATDKSKTLTCQ